MGKRSPKTDIYRKREADRYKNPIPSREFIMDVLADHKGPTSRHQIAKILDLHEPVHLNALGRRLRAMERDGQLIRNRRDSYGLVQKMKLVRGRIVAHPDGFGFLVPDNATDDLFLSAREMRSLMHNDRIVACVTGIDHRGRREGSVVEVLERNTHQVVGRYHEERGVSFVAADDKRVVHDIMVPPELRADARPGQIVVAELVEQPNKRHRPIGSIVEILGEHMAPGMEIDVAIRAHELPFQWSDEALREVRKLKPEVVESAKRGRIDLCEIPLVTIDGPDAKDFDDAVYCEPLSDKKNSGWRLLVAIADVSHYVKPDSGLDDIARERGNSVYFPGRVIPMLPEQLSNGLCSLKPEVDRLCMVCEMQINPSGIIDAYEFYEAVMCSHGRLLYDDVANLIDGDKGLREKYQPLVPHLLELHKLYGAFLKRRGRRGAIDFETTETVIEFGEDKKIERIVALQRNDAHKVIEECMIAANISAAKYLQGHEIPALYRVHEPPKKEKYADLRAFLKDLGLSMPGGEPTAKKYAKMLMQVRDRPDWHLIQTVMLRSLNQAVYSPELVGHFGLALESYAHFTSPIRRYPDLLVHRALKHVLSGKAAERFRYSEANMVASGDACSMTERRADEATRDVVDWLKCEYMIDKVGESFSGVITGVTSFGLFVELNDIYVEGLVHITALNNDYYQFDPVKHLLIGERSRRTFRLAGRAKVRVVRVDLDEKRIDFDLVSGGMRAGSDTAFAKGRKARSKSKKHRGKGAAQSKVHDRKSKTGKKTAVGKKASKKKSLVRKKSAKR